VHFDNLQRIHALDWIVMPFNFIVQNADIHSQLHDELTAVCVDIEGESLFKHKIHVTIGAM